MTSTVIRRLVFGTGALLMFTAVPSHGLAQCNEILMIGSSFSRGVSRYLRNFADAQGQELRVRSLAKNGTCIGFNGGCGAFNLAEGGWLRNHLRSRRTLREIAQPWDAVILQEQSAGLGTGGYNRAADMAEMYAEVTAGGTDPDDVVLFMTWRDSNMSVNNVCSDPGYAYEDYPDRTTTCWHNLRATNNGGGYCPVGRDLGIPVAPIGWAFRQAKRDRPAIELWGPDGHHASALGKFLAAAVLYGTLYHASPLALYNLDPPVYPLTWSADDVLYLLGVAEDVVFTPESYTEAGESIARDDSCEAWGIECVGQTAICQ